MTPEIKQRIEQIQRGEVPEGYIYSNGITTPENWSVGKLKKYTIVADGTHQTPTYIKQGVPFVSVENIPSLYETDKFISFEDYSQFKITPRKNDILMTRITAGIIGDTAMVKDNSPLGYYVSLALIRAIKNVTPHFLNQYINSIYFKRELNKRIIHTAFPKKINLADIGECVIAIPTSSEQDKIVQILATCDKVIELKEKLLVEKQRQKKYLMQQLLTGKMRLPNFSGDWRKTKLKKLLKERKTYSPKGAEYPHVTLSTEGIYAKSQRYDRDHLVKDEDKEYKITYKGDICYNPANLKFGVICMNTFGDAIFSPIYVTFEVVGNTSSEFLSNYLMRWDFINAVRKYEEGTVYERMAVKPEDFLKFEMMLPPYEEQVAIADVFAVVDKEIELLQKELEQEKQKKKALMQLLLTGIVRTK